MVSEDGCSPRSVTRTSLGLLALQGFGDDLGSDFADRSPLALGRTAQADAGASGFQSTVTVAAGRIAAASPSWASYPRT